MNRFRCCLIAAALLAGLNASARAGDQPGFDIGGFGSLGLSYHASEDHEYLRSKDQYEGTRAGQLNAATDSRIGLQLGANSGHGIDAVAQAISRLRSDNSWNPELTWAFVRVSPSPDWQLRAGRIGLETRLQSDSRSIGFAFTPVRVLPELFSLVAYEYFDGADINHQRLIGEALLSAKLYHGFLDTEEPNPMGGITQYGQARISALALSLSQGSWQGRVTGGVVRALDNGSLQELSNGLRATGVPSAVRAAEDIDFQGHYVRFLGLDLRYEQGPVDLEASWIGMRAPGDAVILTSGRGYSVLGSYRIGQFKPYLGFGRASTRNAGVDSGLPEIGALRPLVQTVRYLDQRRERAQQTITLGLRYDINSQLALKFQVDQVRAKRSRLVKDSSSDAHRYRSLTLWSSSLDFIF